jgi:competence protein ComEA
MNPFLDPTLTEPTPTRFRLRGARYRTRRLAGSVVLAASLGLAAFDAGAVDVNSASQSQLEDLRGIGPKTAASIVNERRQGGAFLSFEDLSGRVRGLGDKRLTRLRAAGLTLGGQGRAPAEVLVNMPGKSKGKSGTSAAVD